MKEKEKEKKMSKCHTSKQHRGIFFMLAKKFEMAIFHIIKYNVDNIIFK